MAATAAAATRLSPSSGQKPARPSARPQPKNARHALEPNPFEQSFSSKPSESASPSEDSASTAGRHRNSKEEEGDAASSDDAEKPKTGNKKSTSSPALSSKGHDSGATKVGPRTGVGAAASKDSNATPDKRALPSVASLTSPTQESGSAYPWGPSSLGSLRAGPLSPAMLTGPQHHLSHLNHFDPSTFRTGFTPDLSNFKTGLTPLGSASGFPPPSPGTAAFLAMVNGNGPTMTPNTFNALTNHASSLMNSGEHSGITPMSSDVRNGSNGNQTHDDFDIAFGKQHQQQQQQVNAANTRPKGGAGTGNNVGSDASQHNTNKAGQQKLPPNVHTQSGGAQGATGLFLLSQAHQELSKRDQQQAAVQAQNGQAQQTNAMVQGSQPNPHQSHNGQQGKLSTAPSASASASKGTKRKKSSSSRLNNSSGNEAASGNSAKGAPSSVGAPASTPAKIGKKAKQTPKSESAEPEPDHNDSDDESRDEKFEGDAGSGGDDEEKRKNFLERNRQAALKCRQRKKAWLQDLQSKVAFYEAENGGLQETVGALRNEVMFLKSQLMQLSQHQHQQAGGMPLVPHGMLPQHPQQGGPIGHGPPGGVPQYGPPPPQVGRGPSQGPSFSPNSQAA